MIEWLQRHSLPCFYKQYLGVECPGCGFQWALIELLKGNILGSFFIYPALIPFILLTLGLGIYLIYRNKLLFKIITYLFYFNIMIISAHFIYLQIIKI